MAYKKFFPSQDSYVSSRDGYRTNNYGLGATLDLSVSAGVYFNRALIQFDIGSYTATLTSPTSYTATLTLYDVVNILNTDQNFALELYPITEQWNAGYGQRNRPLTSEVNYIARTALNNWTTSGVTYATSTSASIDFITGNENLTANVSAFTEYWKTNPNYGILIKFPSSIEAVTSNYTNNKTFYSKETHTAFQPTLDIVTDASLIKDDSANIHLGNNTIFFYDKNVSSTAYPGYALISTDLTVTSATSLTTSYFAPNTWYFTFPNTNLIYDELYKIVSNTASNYSVTTSLTSFIPVTSFHNDPSRINANVIMQSSYFDNESPVIRASIYNYVFVGMGSIGMPYYANNVYLFLIEKNTRQIVTPEIELSYDADGYYTSFPMSNLLAGFNYTPIIKIIDGVNNDTIYKEIFESTFFIKKWNNKF